jgi:peptidoglycan/xylan/chitin deacetylase (PgdA/CDA1 family)
VLCYHKIERRREVGVTRIAPKQFARQMDALATAGWRALTLAELHAVARDHTYAVPERAFAITFDDAYRGLRTHAFPVLESLGFPAICAVITDYAGKLNRWDVRIGGRAFAHLAWRDIERWAGRGVTFVSHTATHPRLPWLSAPAASAELARSRDALVAVLGGGVDSRTVAYPFGAAGARERALARAEGYEMGFRLVVPWQGDLMAMPRSPIYPWNRNLPVLSICSRTAAAFVSRISIAASAWRALA